MSSGLIGLTVEKGCSIDTRPCHCAGEVPELVEGTALGKNTYDAYKAENGEEADGGFTEDF